MDKGNSVVTGRFRRRIELDRQTLLLLQVDGIG